MSYDTWIARQPDDWPSVEDAHGDGICECHCDTCGAALSLDPIYGKWYAACGDCHGGTEVDGECFRGGEAAAYERELMHVAQKLK